MTGENSPQDIVIPEYMMKVIKFEMERTFNMPWREVKEWIQKYLQNQYDNLEDKEGSVKLNFPTLQQLKDYITKEIE